MGMVSIVLSVLVVFSALVVLFKAIGAPPTGLLFSRSAIIDIKNNSAKWSFMRIVIICNIFGTLTSLATVYVFFLGTSKVFGGFVLFAPLSMAFSYIIINFFTRKAINDERFGSLLRDSDR